MPILNFFENRIQFNGTPTLKDVLLQNGLASFLPCANSGICHSCTLGACRRVLTGDTVINQSDIVIQKQSDITSVYDGIAIDIGTTTVVCELTLGGKSFVSGCINPQVAVAPDVIGRIGFSINGGSKILQKQIARCIEALIQDVCTRAGIHKSSVDRFVITGNTAMLYFLTDCDANDIATAPFDAKMLFGTFVNDSVYIPRCIDAFVGADTTTAILASGMCSKNEISLLLDIGTNGEIALFDKKHIYVTSAAAGPVFEGAGIECGTVAKSGAIDKVYCANGRIFCSAIDGQKPLGICGSGIIDAVAAFLDAEIIDKTGAKDSDKTYIENGIYITQEDIRNVQLAKSAIATGIEILLREAKIQPEQIDTLYISGGFGTHINLNSATKIGLFPKCLTDRAVVIGNAALGGAKMLLDRKNIREADAVAQNAFSLNLAKTDGFNEKFINNMYF